MLMLCVTGSLSNSYHIQEVLNIDDMYSKKVLNGTQLSKDIEH